MVRVFAPIVAVMVLVFLGGCRTAPIRNVSHAPLAAAPGATLSAEDVSAAIWTAGRKLGWVMQDVRPGEVMGTLRLRKHVAIVTVTYDTSTFSIDYKDSQGLRHQGDEIHRNYTMWVQKLAQGIQGEITRLSSGR